MGAQQSRQITQSLITAITNLNIDQTNACSTSTSQIVDFKIIGSENVEIINKEIRQAVEAVANCAQSAATNSKIQSEIDQAIQQAVKQAKEALNFNPGNQTSENIISTAVQIANTVNQSMANTCNVSTGQAATFNIIDSKNVKVANDVINQYANLRASCTQNLSSINSIINRVEQDFKQTTEQTQSAGWLLVLIIIVIVVYFVLIYSQSGKTRTAIIIFGMILLALLIAYYIKLKTTKPDQTKNKDQAEKNSAESNKFIEASVARGLKACTDSKTAGYAPTQGFYYTFDPNAKPYLGPYVPDAKIVNGQLEPRRRDGGAPGGSLPPGYQPSAVRQNADILGVGYADNEQDMSICTRKDLANPSMTDMAAKILGK